jgi:N-hydroxyarylamine O-acetyltransferase
MIDWLALLARLGVTDAEPALETLQRLQRQALLSLPFENLDIHLGRPILLDHTAIYLKIVVGDRGGFCYELNECFYQCLKALGYDIDRLEGRVVIGGPGAPFDHQCALVRLDGVRWWVDIGFGDSTLVPLDLDRRDEQTDGRSRFKIEEAEGFFEISRQMEPGKWTKMLKLNSAPQDWDRFADRCQWQQHAPDSAFVRKRVCTRATETGRITLAGNTLKRVDRKTVETPVEEDRYTAILAKHFGMTLVAPTWTKPQA